MVEIIDIIRERNFLENPFYSMDQFQACLFEDMLYEIEESKRAPAATENRMFTVDEDGISLFNEIYANHLPKKEDIMRELQKAFAIYGGLENLYNMTMQDINAAKRAAHDSIHFKVYDLLLEFCINAYKRNTPETIVYLEARPGLNGISGLESTIEKITLPLYTARGQMLLRAVREIHYADLDKEIARETYMISKREGGNQSIPFFARELNALKKKEEMNEEKIAWP